MLEKLTLNNMRIFTRLHNNSLREVTYDRNFIEYYINQNFLIKMILRRFVKIIKINGEPVGYIWAEFLNGDFSRVFSLYVDTRFINLLNKSMLSYFDGRILSYESVDNEKNKIILSNLGFTEKSYSILMSMNIESYSDEKIDEVKSNINYNLSTRKMIIGKDETLRCNIQNQIFEHNTRKNLTISDIYEDEAQEYFLKDLCIFGQVQNSYIGYGQIIFSRKMFTIVNFGIIKSFRSLGLGKLFLHEIILYAKNNGIKELAIRVDSTNLQAINLYKWIGFKKKYDIISWERY